MDYSKFSSIKVTFPLEYVAHVALNNPKKMNAMMGKTFEEVTECFQALSYDGNCRAVVLSGGEAKCFSAGIDVGYLSSAFVDSSGGDVDPVRRMMSVGYQGLKMMQDCCSSLAKCQKPVIAATWKFCIGAGLELVCGADIRVAHPDTTFSVREVRMGIPADLGGLQRFPKICRGNTNLAMELMYTGRDFLASEAVAKNLGWCETAEKPLERAMEIATQIAKLSPVAVIGTKRTVQFSADRLVEDGLEFVAQLNTGGVFNGEDVVKAVTERDQAVFSKL